MTDLHDGLRAWARGIFPLEAAVELLIRDGRAVYVGAPWRQHNGDLISVDVDQLLHETGAWSSGERQLVAIAASLLSSDHPVDLNDAVSGLGPDRDDAGAGGDRACERFARARWVRVRRERQAHSDHPV